MVTLSSITPARPKAASTASWLRVCLAMSSSAALTDVQSQATAMISKDIISFPGYGVVSL
jgi:hypothetical protein